MANRELFVSIRLDGPISEAQTEAMLRVLQSRNIAAMKVNEGKIGLKQHELTALLAENVVRGKLAKYLEGAIRETSNVHDSVVALVEMDAIALDLDQQAIMNDAGVSASVAIITDIMSRAEDFVPPGTPSH